MAHGQTHASEIVAGKLRGIEGGKISEEWAAEDLTAILNDTGTYKAPRIP